MLRFKNWFLKYILQSELSDNLKIFSYQDELNRQCLRFIPFINLIFILAWLPYIPIDKILHPYFSHVFWLRIGLSIAGILSSVVFYFRLISKNMGIKLVLFLGIYLVLATAALTGLSKGGTVYFGGFLFIIMSLILIPLRFYILWILIIGGFGIFLFISHFFVTTFNNIFTRYSFSDLRSAVLVSLLFTFLVDKIRYKSYLKSCELEKERNFLKQQNDVLAAELNMAKSIQENMMPSKTPNHKISSLYKPMSQLGGDFFDFITFTDSGKFGVFLSDVSGHGVPAAFITSMIKGFLLKAGETLKDPAQLLQYLNENLHNQTSGHFMTAFYGIYDSENKKIIYSNAGHNLPFLIGKDSVCFFSGENKSLPLAVLSNLELKDLNKSYKNHTMEILDNSRVIFYTDGLVETVNIHKPDTDFGSLSLIQLIEEYRECSPQKFLIRIFEKLIEFRGSEELEDDVCIICMDT
ncbi:MAG TPA: hypothetical protein DHW82_10275 [Spirochaetia bacterium]|nr:MAG: hypothetical protein A2Y41_00610 [Spirochaetes bacterium GWB1_36_13]HCL57377.1 hypothetical protein [Spirochaetia bacterium]